MRSFACLAVLALAAAASLPTRYHTAHVYHYTYDGQIATGLPLDSQYAATRLRAAVKLAFDDERVIVKMDDVQMGYTNDKTSLESISPMKLFTVLPTEETRVLSLPFSARYLDGVFSDLVFDRDDVVWSENAKRAILNMLQTTQNKKALFDSEMKRSELDSYTVQEKTLEGDCEVVYTSMPTEEEMLEITKAVSFESCRRRADIRSNYRFGAACTAESCADKWTTAQSNTHSQTVINMNATQHGLIHSVEARSLYSFSPFDSSSLLSTRVLATLTLSKVNKGHVELPTETKPATTLLYSTEMEQYEERWIVKGEQEWLAFEPLAKLDKVTEARKLIAQLVKKNEKKEHDEFFPRTVARLVEIMRVCTRTELESIFALLPEIELSVADTEKINHMLVDCLAVAGTRVTIEYFTELVVSGKVTPAKASVAMKTFVNVRLAGEKTLEAVYSMCDSKLARHSPALRQSCLLSYGAMLRATCGRTTDSFALEKTDICDTTFETKVVKQLRKLFESVETRYEKILALKTFANAGLVSSMELLEKVMFDRSEETVIRVQAVEALRQLTTVVPKEVRSVLLPIFLSSVEPAELRVSAIRVLLRSRPDRAILVQIARALNQEHDQHVFAYTHSLLEKLSVSTAACEQHLATRVRAALRFIRPRPLVSSRYLRANLYSHKLNFGGLLNLGAILGNDSFLPKEMHSALDTAFGGQWMRSMLEIGVQQHNVDRVLMRVWKKMEASHEPAMFVRGKRSALARPADMLRSIMNKLGIFRRDEQTVEDVHAMIYLRYKDLDYAVLPMEEKLIAELLEKLFVSGHIDLGRVERVFADGLGLRGSLASFVYESRRRMPTVLGLPLLVSGKMPTVASVDGKLRLVLLPENGERVDGMRFEIDLDTAVAATHITEMRVISPLHLNGVKLVHHAHVALPINARLSLNWHKPAFELVFVRPTEQRRIFSLHSNAVVFAKKLSMEMYPESEERTIHLQLAKVNSFERESTVFRLAANLHSGLRSVPAVLSSDNSIDLFLLPGNKLVFKGAIAKDDTLIQDRLFKKIVTNVRDLDVQQYKLIFKHLIGSEEKLDAVLRYAYNPVKYMLNAMLETVYKNKKIVSVMSFDKTEGAMHNEWEMDKKSVLGFSYKFEENEFQLNVEHKMSPVETRYLNKLYQLLKARNLFTAQLAVSDVDDSNIVLVAKPVGKLIEMTLEMNNEKMMWLESAFPFFRMEQMQNVMESECRVEETKITTFDRLFLNAPLTGCYSVLAKDCSEQPRFAVLAKQLTEQYKKVKLIGHKHVIEAYLDNEKMVIEINDEIVEDEQLLKKYNIRFESESKVVMVVEGVRVVFDGVDVLVRLPATFKNQQCGLCGHFDGVSRNDIRKADNTETENVREFFDSFLVKDEECDERIVSEVDNFRILENEWQKETVEDDVSDETYEVEMPKKMVVEKKKMAYTEGESVEPVQRTRVLEFTHTVCFSRQPLPACHELTSEEQTVREMVDFVCVPRDNVLTARLMRDARRYDVVSVEKIEAIPDFEQMQQSLRVPKTCLAF